MENPLSKLDLDYWYQSLMVVSVAVLLSSGAGVLKAFPTVPTALISLGCFGIGLGESKNHPLQTSILPPTVYRPGGILTGHPRRSSAVGNIIVVLGIILVALGIYKSLR
jgi:hypothetical protein